MPLRWLSSSSKKLAEDPGRLVAARLRRTHRRCSGFVDLDHVAAGVRAAREAFEAFGAPRDDRVGVGPRLDHVPLFLLLVEERVEAVPPSTGCVDLAHRREYRKIGRSAGAGSRIVCWRWGLANVLQ